MRGAESTQAHPKDPCPLPGSGQGCSRVSGPFHLSGSVIQSNGALGINQDPFPVREPVCAGTDKTRGGRTQQWGNDIVGKGGRGGGGLDLTHRDKDAEK